MMALNSAVRAAINEHDAVRTQGVQVLRDDGLHLVDIEVLPLEPAQVSGRYFLVVFQEASVATEAAAARRSPEAAGELDREQLEQELAATREYLQSVIEQQESTNEELHSANEEIQSSNEELQSINEELETAKEELQSTNEEVSTVNEELATRNRELYDLNSDLNNLIASVDIPIVFVGPDLRVRRFTPQAEPLLNLIPGDVGRPLADLRHKIDIPGLSEHLLEVMRTVQPLELERQDQDGHWYSVRIRPYRTVDNRIDGVLLAFIDIDRMQRVLLEVSEARDYAEAVIRAVRHPLLVLDPQLRVVSASDAYLEAFQVESRDLIGNLLHKLGSGEWAEPGLRRRLGTCVSRGEPLNDYRIEHEFEHRGRRAMSVSARQIPAQGEAGARVLMQIEDLSRRESAAGA